MGDGLVKWRMAKIPTVVELVSQLPKEEMSELQFRNEMKHSIYGEGFIRTAYQLACQLGLYCIDNGKYIPRFTHDITESEAKTFMENWIWNYYMPNPYTKSFIKTCNPKYVLSTIISYLESHPEEKNLGAICFNIWEEPIGNLPNLKYVLNEYSKVITINNSNEVILQPNYKEIMKEQLDRNDKKKFYDIVGGISCRTSDTKPIVPTDDEISLVSQQYNYISAIKAKPFLILGGFSGTGKSQQVKELAFATCPCDGILNTSETSPGNYLLVSVKPNWHDASDITGFRSSVNKNYYVTDFMRFLVKAKAYESKKVPFFVCLDEMNLAPVEEYFADFLSVIESRKRTEDGRIVTDPIVPASVFNDTYSDDFNIFIRLGLQPVSSEWKEDEINALDTDDKKQAFIRQDIVDELMREGLTIPQNVIIIGTVNMDDTTNTFSRKVIDRAMTFETIVNTFGLDYFEKDVPLHYVKNPLPGEYFISDEVRATHMIESGRFSLTEKEEQDVLAFINGINKDMEGTPFKISYRILNETILLYHSKRRLKELLEENGDSRVTIHDGLNTIFDDILMQKVLPRIEGDYDKCCKCLTKLSSRCAENSWNKSEDKIEFMIERFGKDKSGFTSFWN
jgi:hypothetical protein